MKAMWKGEVIAESDDTVVVDGEYYFPPASVNQRFLTFSNHRSSSWKGQARYASLLVGGELLTDAAWTYPEPSQAAAQLAGRYAFGKGVIVA